MTVYSGDREVVTALTPEEAYTLKFGGTVTDVAGDVPRSMADAIVGGVASGIARSTRKAVAQALLGNALRNATVPTDTHHGGALYMGRQNIAEPVSVRVSLSGREYLMRFGGKP